MIQQRVAGLDGFGELAGEGVRRLAVEHDVVRPVAVAAPDEILVPRLDGFERGLVVAPVDPVAIDRAPVRTRGDVVEHEFVGPFPGIGLGTIVSGGNASVEILVTTPTTLGTITNNASVTANEVDPTPADNSICRLPHG